MPSDSETASSYIVEKRGWKSLGKYLGALLLLTCPEGCGESVSLGEERKGAGWAGSNCSPTPVILENS